MSGVNRIGGGQENLQPIEKKSGDNEIINKQTRDSIKETTNIKNIEKIVPESTGHKVGRIIAGILGGLLLAAGIAAATVAVTATLGVAVGVLGTVAAFAGITGSSIAAGAAGCAGIGLITTSALLAPKHSEDFADDRISEAENSAQENQEIKNEPEETVDLKNIDFSKNKAKSIFDSMVSRIIDVETGRIDTKATNQTVYQNILFFVSTVLYESNIKDENVTNQSIAAVKQAVTQCTQGLSDGRGGHIDYAVKLNKKEIKEELMNELNRKDREVPQFLAQKEYLVRIFIEALSEDNEVNNVNQQNMIEV